MSRPGWIGHLGMPRWLRGSPLEAPSRRLARRIKKTATDVERIARRGRVRVRLPSSTEWIRLDFDFAFMNTVPSQDPLFSALLTHVLSTHTVYDVGAFVGWYSIAAARRAHSGQVFSFEPVPESADLARRHCMLNQVTDRVRIIEAACGKETGIVSMPVRPVRTTSWASGNSLLNVYPESDVQPTLTPVTVIRLDDFVSAGAPPPDLIKVDVEGAELWVLEGAREILKTRRPIVLLELHRFAWHHFGTTEEGFREFIASIGYQLLEIGDARHKMATIPDYGHGILAPTESVN
jgi:FkbM family methyltransferase